MAAQLHMKGETDKKNVISPQLNVLLLQNMCLFIWTFLVYLHKESSMSEEWLLSRGGSSSN